MPTTPSQARETLQALVDHYYVRYSPEVRVTQSEANVRANFIDPLFAALGWPVNDPQHYNREAYIRPTTSSGHGGLADVGLSVDPTAGPILFVEAKRFGAIDPLERVQDQRDRSVAQFRLPGIAVDRTREEQQAINYAYEQGIRWAVLTNFERLRLFNASRDTLVLNFDNPRELLERFEELWVLSFDQVSRGRLDELRAHRERGDIDQEYLRLVNEWRLRLGQDIYSHRENSPWLADPNSGEFDVRRLRDAVQRALDRLVVVRYAEDRLVIRPDQLRGLVEQQLRVDYAVPLLEQIRYFFREFNVRHNGTLFAEHFSDKLTISQDILTAVILNLYDARFRAMSPDIMGNTYEQYLGQTLVLHRDQVQAADNLETRKAQGSYYTPEYVVRYIVDHTLGRLLYATQNGRPDGPPIQGERPKTLDEIDGSDGRPPLSVLDPASGSGSFLIYAYHVLERFYQDEIARLQAERDAHAQELLAQEISPMDVRVELAVQDRRLQTLADYKNRILERHLYGVDLDPQAAELAAVNLMLRAMERGRRLPLILNQNIKVGNSLISGLSPADADALAPHTPQLAELRRLRLAQQGAASDALRVADLQDRIDALRAEVNVALNAPLSAHFDDVENRLPFNWPVEFPEIFAGEDGRLREDGGFTVVVGNPPYLNVDATWGKKSPAAGYLQQAYREIWAGKSDAFYYFIRRALSLLAPNGRHGFITARYYLEAYYASKLRKLMLDEAQLTQIVDFGDYVVFAGVGTKTCITLSIRQPTPETRQQNQFLFARARNKSIDVLDFLQRFAQEATPFSQNALDADSWNLFKDAIAQVIAQIDCDSTPMGELAFIGKGMETGRNGVFVVDQDTIRRYQIEADLIRQVVKNQDIKPYALDFRGLYLIYPNDVDNLDNYPHAKAYLLEHREALEARAAFRRGDCEWYKFTWPLHQEQYGVPKLMTPYIAPHNRFALDDKVEFIGLTDTTMIFPTEQSPDLRYLLALLNSRLLNFRYRYIAKAKDYRYEYFENSLAKIPIRLADAPLAQEITSLAQTMHDLNRARQIIANVFDECLAAREHTRRSFYDAYYAHSEYRETHLFRVGPADANACGVVSDIHVDEDRDCLNVHVNVETAGEIPLVSLRITNPDLRRFLLLSLRADLRAKRRKQKWSSDRLLRGALGALETPTLVETAASANLVAIADLMAEVQRRVTERLADELGERASEINDPLALSQIESTLAATERQIDTLVYELYGLSPEEIAIVEEQ